ncbi:hypothetical protein BKA62DRAFT_494106 [Auriculariales sp. MPI-PUGE-AT-0066]|nr:hypothetical protein BKA62DRAFT_494106 [Auriculariales sp. MPI-PUGE-AT-0066]
MADRFFISRPLKIVALIHSVMFAAAVAAVTCALGVSAAAVAPRAVAAGSYAIQDTTSGLFVVSYDAKKALVPTVATVAEATVFQIGSLASGSQFMRNYELNKLVTADSSGTVPFESSRDTIGSFESFDFDAVTGGYRIRALSNSLFATTTSSGLVNGATVSNFTTYAVVSAETPATQGATVASLTYIQDYATGLYLTQDAAGAITASATSNATATTFLLSTTGSSTTVTTIESQTNGLFLTAHDTGDQTLAASAAAASTWEQFSFFGIFVQGAGSVYKIKSKSNGLYLKTTANGVVNSAYSQLSGTLYKVWQANPGRV